MNKIVAIFSLLVLLQVPTQAQAACAEWLDVEINKLNSSEVIDLCSVLGERPVLLVNTASYCGYTYQFTGLEGLHQRFRDQGLVVIGFPTDDFNQEDDDADKTAEVCFVNHGVTFLMTEQIKVKGAGAHPLFAHLGRASEAPGWNFNKYLVNREGEVVQHFGSRVEPDDAALISAIEGVL